MDTCRLKTIFWYDQMWMRKLAMKHDSNKINVQHVCFVHRGIDQPGYEV